MLPPYLEGGTAQTADRAARRPHETLEVQPSDIDERAHWDDYQQAYSDALTQCNTEAAPWYAVPADRKWYRNWAVTKILTEQLDEMALTWPVPQGWDVEKERARVAADPDCP